MRRLLIPLAMSVALVACGDSGVSKADYIAKADAFCEKANAEGKKRNQRLAQIATEAHSESEFWGKAIPELEDSLEWAREQQAEFRKIEPPDDDRDTVEAIHAANEKELDIFARAVDAARARDLQQFTQIADEQQKASDRANELARDYGFKRCGEDSTADVS